MRRSRTLQLFISGSVVGFSLLMLAWILPLWLVAIIAAWAFALVFGGA